MEGHENYVALYSATNESGVDLVVNDIIEVTKQLSVDASEKTETSGWIKGRNRRTGKDGYFPSMSSEHIILHKFNSYVLFSSYISDASF